MEEKKEQEEKEGEREKGDPLLFVRAHLSLSRFFSSFTARTTVLPARISSVLPPTSSSRQFLPHLLYIFRIMRQSFSFLPLLISLFAYTCLRKVTQHTPVYRRRANAKEHTRDCQLTNVREREKPREHNIGKSKKRT